MSTQRSVLFREERGREWEEKRGGGGEGGNGLKKRMNGRKEEKGKRWEREEDVKEEWKVVERN